MVLLVIVMYMNGNIQSEIVKYGIHNFYSQKDSVLKYLYKTFELGDNPIGLNPISSNSKILKTMMFHIQSKDTLNIKKKKKKNLQTILKI